MWHSVASRDDAGKADGSGGPDPSGVDDDEDDDDEEEDDEDDEKKKTKGSLLLLLLLVVVLLLLFARGEALTWPTGGATYIPMLLRGQPTSRISKATKATITTTTTLFFS